MKKIVFCLLMLILVLPLGGCSNDYGIKEVNFKDVKKMIDNKETFMLEIVQTGCGACQDFSPRFEKILNDKKLFAYSINLTNMSKDERYKLDDIANVSGTPTVVFFYEGEEKSTLHRIAGAVDDDRIISKLKSNGYLK